MSTYPRQPRYTALLVTIALLLLVLVGDAAYSRYQEYKARESLKGTVEYIKNGGKIDATEAISLGQKYMQRLRESAEKESSPKK